jgi:hypothetical protein
MEQHLTRRQAIERASAASAAADLVAGRAQAAGTLTWTTMPEQLQARGVEWRVCTDPGPEQIPANRMPRQERGRARRPVP